MKRILFALAVILLLYPDVSFSAYIIYLKNGGQIEADAYWKEGNQIRYRIKDGEVGISIDEVLKIKEVTEEPKKKENKKETDKNLPTAAESPAKASDKEALRLLIGSKKADLNATDQIIFEIEKKLEFIKTKEKELNDITMEIGRPKYALLIREKRELEAKKDRLSQEVEELRNEKDELMNNLKEFKDRRNIIENELSDLEYEERYGTHPPVPSGQ